MSNYCRTFEGRNALGTLYLDRFAGQWFTQFYQRNAAPNREGTCPISWFEPKKSTHDNGRAFLWRQVSRAATVGINRDVTMRGLMEPKDSPIGTVWFSVLTNPLKRDHGNFRVVSTDYDNYAILYRCAQQFTHQLHGKEQVLVMTRK